MKNNLGLEHIQYKELQPHKVCHRALFFYLSHFVFRIIMFALYYYEIICK